MDVFKENPIINDPQSRWYQYHMGAPNIWPFFTYDNGNY